MRLTPDRAKLAIAHADQEVRFAAVDYFAKSFSRDSDVLPLALQVIDQYGEEQAFTYHSFLSGLAHTEQSLRWVLERLKVTDRAVQDEDFNLRFPTHLIKSLTGADTDLLAPYEEVIPTLECLDDEDRHLLAERIRMAASDPHDLWSELENFCEQHKEDDEYPADDMDQAFRLIEALGRHSDLLGDKILELLAVEADFEENDPMAWMEIFAVRIAGEMRLESACDLVVKKLHRDEEDFLNEECLWALIKIGTDSVVNALAAESAEASWEFCLSAAAILADIHSDRSVDICLERLQQEEDDLVGIFLLKALLKNGATDAFDSVRDFLLETDRDPEWIELRSELITAATLMDFSFPEFSEWKTDMEHDQAFRKQWYAEERERREAAYAEDYVDDDDWDDGYFDDGYDTNDYGGDAFTLPESPTTIVTGQRTGRNEPCPCGSGKKFKKCCLKKQNETLPS